MGRRVARAAVAVVLACGAVTAFAPGAGADPAWSIVTAPSPPGPPGAAIQGVACASPSECFAVGNGASGQAIIEKWDGIRWTTSASPALSGAVSTQLGGVACASPVNCFAVGGSNSADIPAPQTLVEHWDGASWSIVPSPNNPLPYGSTLSAVSCPSLTSCFAVGTDLIEQWDGTSWSIMSGPNSVTSTRHALLSVSCASTASCFAVGADSSNPIAKVTLTEKWDGATWSIVASPSPKLSKFAFGGDSLLGVSCASATNCAAVGGSGNVATLIEHWNGTSWTVSSAPKLKFGGTLSAVSCPSATSCFAVGRKETDTSFWPSLVERWNGKTWSVATSPNPHPGQINLAGVSCASTASCVTVGSYSFTTSGESFGERWNGKVWSLTPQPSDSSQSSIVSTSCSSATSCFAVGNYVSGFVQKTLVERWDGASVSIVPSPNPAGAQTSALTGVSCSSATACIAVGSADAGGVIAPLIERWDGTRWSIAPTAKIAHTEESAFASVSCASATSCFAAGYRLGTEEVNTLIERWNGTKWSVSLDNDPSGFQNRLQDISCAAANSCVAVGFVSSDLPSQVLTEHWNGSTWAAKIDPKTDTSLSTVSCASPTSCLALGSDGVGILAERWTGKAFVKITAANPVPGAGIGGVSCQAATCVLVGSDFVGGYPGQPLVEQWDGTNFSVVPSPATAMPAALAGVSCVGASCFAVGNYHTSDPSQVLAEHTR